MFQQRLQRSVQVLKRRADDLALGIERLGLVSLRFPAVVGSLALVLAVFCGFGIARIRIDDSLSQLFHSDTPEFRVYQQEIAQVSFQRVRRSRRRPRQDAAATRLDREVAKSRHRSAADRRNLGIISLFSAREPPEDGKLPGPLIPEELPQGAAYEQLAQRIRANEILRNKLLSEDGNLTLIVLALDPDAVQSARLSHVVSQIRQTARDDLAGASLEASLTGVPVMQLEIRNALERDRIIYNAFGFAAGCLIAIVFFRRASYMMVAAGPPLLAILFGLGTLGWLDFQLNLFLNVMTPLIMVISFSDSMQLTFAARDRLIAGADRRTAFRDAILVVGPACVLTHGTAALSFIALQFSQSDLIRSFGAAGLISTVIALVTVLTLVPLFGILLVWDEAAPAASAEKSDRAVEFLRTFCNWVATRMVSRPAAYSLIGLLVVCCLGAVYAQLQPRYRLADQVPDQGQAVAASGRLDAELTGANPINVMIQLPPGLSLYAPASLQVIAEVHHVMESEPEIGNVWSLETLRRWLAEKAGENEVATLKQYVDILPQYLVRRFISANQRAVLVAGRVPDLDASRIRPIVRSLDRALAPIRAHHPGFTMSVTSLSAIAARNSAIMIEKLNRGLTVEVVFVAAFIGLAFRSWRVMAASILPAIFPIVAAGALLWVLGDGLQFASVIALTVSFGLGMSATIHFLNRLRLEERSSTGIDAAVRRATVLMGPALILTSIVLACGMVVTVFSNLPSLRLFGWLTTLAMILALVADLTILRPTITLLRSLSAR